MAWEIEIKARVKKPELVKRKLDARARFQGSTDKHDRYFAERPLVDVNFEEDRMFRLRTAGGQMQLTAKQRQVIEGVEENLELEFGLEGDADEFLSLARYLGYEVVVEKRKQSLVYTVPKAVIELTQVEGLGWFLEVEYTGPVEKVPRDAIRGTLFSILDDLQIAREQIEPRLYLELLQASVRATDTERQD